MNYLMKRVKTDIKGFDELIEGGFPERSNILITGEAGTGKTIFGLQYLYNGAIHHKEKGLYITFEQSKENIEEQGRQLGMKLPSDDVTILYLSPSDITSVEQVLKIIFDEEMKNRIKRVVIDSLPALYINSLQAARKMSRKKGLFHRHTEAEALDDKSFIYYLLNDINKMAITTLFIGEVSKNPSDNLNFISEYAVDGVIKLYYDSIDTYKRSLLVKKMRLTDKAEEPYPFEITKKGIVVYDI
jgi:circadian clock protein KaiC